MLCLTNVICYAGSKPQLAYPDNYKKTQKEEDVIDLEEESINEVDGLNDFKKCVFDSEHNAERKFSHFNLFSMRNKMRYTLILMILQLELCSIIILNLYSYFKGKDQFLNNVPPNGNLKLSPEEMKIG